MAVGPFAVAVTLLIKFVGEQIEGPDLASVGVAAYLDVCAQGVGKGKVVWLMVEYNGINLSFSAIAGTN